MFKEDAIEAAPIVNATLGSLIEWVPMRGREGADLRSAVNYVRASTLRLLQTDKLGPPLVLCFDRAMAAGVNLTQALRVRATASAFTPESAGAILVKDSLIELALVTACQVVATTTFRSRKNVEEANATLNAAFQEIEEEVADQMDAMTFRALVTLHAAVSFYLIETARPLPQVLRFRFNLPLPSLVIAQKLYHDGGRADELRAENKVVHPLFSPPTGRGLSF